MKRNTMKTLSRKLLLALTIALPLTAPRASAAGAVVVLTATARNSAGESPAGNTVEITVP